MQKKQLRELLERYRLGRCTPDELQLLYKTFNQVPLSDTLPIEEHELLTLQQQALADFHTIVDQDNQTWIRVRRALPYAAVLVAALLVGLYLFVYKQTGNADGHQIAASEILPGTHRATLTLNNGTVINLNESQEGIVVNDSKITYTDDEKKTIVNLTAQTTPNVTLSTPKGGTYAVTLPDGSKVWLNAASALTYPVKFEGNERVVSVAGEALFSVAKDPKRPFKVMSKDQQIEVLGTEFNISAYPEDNLTTTTLVDGSVKVARNNEGGTILKPGEQVVNKAGTLSSRRVDVSQYTAWKDGFFYFKRLPLETALTQLARWYDIQVIYEGEIPQINLFAELDRKLPLGSVLKSLERSGLQFKVVRSDEVNQLIVLDEFTNEQK